MSQNQSEKKQTRNDRGREAFSHWELFFYRLIFMTMMLFASHGTQDMYPTFLQRQWHLSPSRRSAIIAPAFTLGAGAFLMQFMVQGAWGVVPAHLAELSPDSMRAFLPGFAYQSRCARELSGIRRSRLRTEHELLNGLGLDRSRCIHPSGDHDGPRTRASRSKLWFVRPGRSTSRQHAIADFEETGNYSNSRTHLPRWARSLFPNFNGIGARYSLLLTCSPVGFHPRFLGRRATSAFERGGNVKA